MKRPPLLIVLLVLAHGLVGVVVCLQIDFRGPGPQGLRLFGIALSIGHVSLATTWLCFGRTYFIVRLTVTALVMWLWVVVYLVAGARPEFTLPLFMMAIATAVAVILFVLRWFGLAIEMQSEQPRSAHSAFQFSIGQLLVWMTVVAVSLGILKGIGVHDAGSRDVVIVLSIGFLLAPVAITSLWLALGRRRLGWRIATALVHPLLAAATLGVAVAGDPLDDVCYKLAITTAGLCLISLFVVRQCGYRLERQRPEGDVTGVDEPAAEEEAAAEVHPLDGHDEERPQS